MSLFSRRIDKNWSRIFDQGALLSYHFIQLLKVNYLIIQFIICQFALLQAKNILQLQQKSNMYRSLSSVAIEQKDSIIWNQKSDQALHSKSDFKIDISKVFKASNFFSNTQTIKLSSFSKVDQLSELFDANIYVKRQDEQLSKTFKIRGAYYKYNINKQKNKITEFVVPSDGNFACACATIAGLYKIKYHLFVPLSCFQHKRKYMERQGKQFIQIHQVGSDYQECVEQARKFAKQKNLEFLHPFQTNSLLPGYATVAKQMLEQMKEVNFDYILVPTGGGGLVSSIASFVKQTSPQTKVISVQTDIATPFSSSLQSNKLVTSQKASKFCNGSSVKQTNSQIYNIARTSVDGYITVSQNLIAQMVIRLYSIGIISQPSGALGIAGLSKIRNLIKGKNIAVILTGAHIDLTQLNQARQMNVISKGYKNCYIIELSNKKNALYELINTCFKQSDVISIQYSKKASKQSSQALLSVQSLTQDDVQESIEKLRDGKYTFQIINEKQQLLDIFF